jgi:peptidoglycan/LPS O-acetylase OafA/YrhL
MSGGRWAGDEGSGGRLNLLDGLRFLAAIAVVAYHFTVYPYEWGWSERPVSIFGPVTAVTGYGYLGVYLFFIISGFVIMLSARGRTVGQFVSSRMARLLPAYWAAVLLSGLAAPFVLDGRITSQNIRQTAVNLTMLEKPFGVPYVDNVYWTLWVELCFYLIVGIVLLSGIGYGKILALAALWPLGAVLVQAASKQFAEVLQPTYAPFFAGGIGLYLVFAYGHRLLHWLIVGMNAVLAADNAALTAAPVRSTTAAPVSSVVAFALVIVFFAAVAVATITPAREWTGALGTRLGALTYPLYLVHVFPGLITIQFTHRAIGTWPSLLLGVAVALTLAWAVNRFAERPLSRPMRKRLERTFVRAGEKAPKTPAVD